MSVNRERLHLLVLPEDDANRQILIGFLQEFPPGQIQRLPEADGWGKVLDEFESEHVPGLRKYGRRMILLLIDFDRQSDRFSKARARIPEDLTDRVFILGAWKDPEGLSSAGLGSREEIGRKMAADCRDNTDAIWEHELLRHNKDELDRLCPRIREILSL